MKEEIYKLIPHREPFLFVDKIEEIRENGATTSRTIRAEEPQFEGHYPGNPIMPGVLLCEAVFQTAGIYLSKKIEESGGSIKELTPILSRIKEAKFKQMVKPGDHVMIEVTEDEKLGKFYFMKGKVMKEGKTVVTVDFAIALIDESQEA